MIDESEKLKKIGCISYFLLFIIIFKSILIKSLVGQYIFLINLLFIKLNINLTFLFLNYIYTFFQIKIIFHIKIIFF